MSQKIQCKKIRHLKKFSVKKFNVSKNSVQKNSTSQKIQCKNIQSQHPGYIQGEAIDPCIKSSNVQPIKLRSIGHVTPKHECELKFGGVSWSELSMAENASDGASVSVLFIYLLYLYLRCTLTEFVEQCLQETFNEVAFVKSVLAISQRYVS